MIMFSQTHRISRLVETYTEKTQWFHLNGLKLMNQIEKKICVIVF